MEHTFVTKLKFDDPNSSVLISRETFLTALERYQEKVHNTYAYGKTLEDDCHDRFCTDLAKSPYLIKSIALNDDDMLVVTVDTLSDTSAPLFLGKCFPSTKINVEEK